MHLSFRSVTSCLFPKHGMNTVLENVRCISRLPPLGQFSAAEPTQPAAAEPTQPAAAEPTQPAATELQSTRSLPDYRFVYPEFLPEPDLTRRNKLREKLERKDMLLRRHHVQIPEFYVGSIMAVTVSDPQAPGKYSRFVGICILREGTGLQATFTLRNIVEHQGIEIIYPMYNPTLQKIEVLRLEKRLDEDMRYLRDAPHEYSTFPQDMDQEPVGASGVTVNNLKVPLNPRPWTWRWERSAELHGFILPELRFDFYEKAKARAEPWHKYDLMQEYRASVTEQDQNEVYADVHAHLQTQQVRQKAVLRRRAFVPPKKTS